MRQVSHAIFDFDGLLVNTETLYTQAFDDLCMKWVGKHYTFEIKERMMGRPWLDAVATLKEMLEIPLSIEEIESTSRTYAHKLMHTAELTPGAERLVRHLYKHGIPMAIATGSDAEMYEGKIVRHKDFFGKHFEHVVLSSDPAVKRGKPAPDIFLLAAQRFKRPPMDFSRCIVFEDAPLGIQGALAAGMYAVWVPSIPDLDTSQLPAHAVLPSLEQFCPENFGLPPFD